MNKPPCIKNKCITYPTCKHKQIVRCKILYDWIDSERDPNYLSDMILWNKITDYFPNINDVVREIDTGNIHRSTTIKINRFLYMDA